MDNIQSPDWTLNRLKLTTIVIYYILIVLNARTLQNSSHPRGAKGLVLRRQEPSCLSNNVLEWNGHEGSHCN